MQPLLLLIYLLGFVVSDNATVDEVSEVTNTGNDVDAATLEETTTWGKWSACSRSCDGGVSRQQRRCRRKFCKGRPWSVKYKVCNTQPCEEASDFRAEQCAAFNNVPYSGQLLKWLPHYDPTRPCSLICRGLQASYDETNDKRGMRGGRELPEAEDSLAELDAEETIVVQLADKVKDGTRCRPEGPDVCIGGECTKVGCDLKIGSKKKRDVCGVCGGDGTNCQSRYAWSLEPISACSKPCGGGFKIAMITCKTLGSDQGVVDDSYCDLDKKPSKSLLPCNSHPCPRKWVTGDWNKCSASCGGGSRTRLVFCSEENGNETKELPDHKCNGVHKPRHQETCNTFSCPMWETGQWNECSVSCGDGIKTRMVDCRDGRGRRSLDCDPLEKPRTEQECETNVPCSNYYEDSAESLMQAYQPAPVPEKLIDQPVPSESTFIAENWSPCSVTCGEGIRHREVHCKIFLEFSRTIAKLPDRQCSGPKPVETEKCIVEPCSLMGNSLSYKIDTVGDSGYVESNLKDAYRSSSGILSSSSYESSVKVAAGSTVQTTYSWKEAGYTHCSATCLGGIQELIISCVRDDTGKAVMPLLCTPETKPESRIRTCNDHPCPPRWNYSDFSPCRSPCGIGIQTRDVICIHEVTRDTGNIVHVPNSMCPQPPPADRQYCNVLDCPAEWHVGNWSKCSRSCGGGLKKRTVTCEQIVAQGHVQTRSESACPPEKPDFEKPCNTKTCHETGLGYQSVILSLNTTFNQVDPNKKVDLKIGGSAFVFVGTSVVKIRCPVKKFDKSQITWTKDRMELRKSKKYKISRKGALRIMDIMYSDRGTYACIAGHSQAETRLFVKSRSREQMSSEELLRFGNTVHQDVNLDSAPSNSGENVHTDHAAPAYGSPFAFGGEDLSHEARFDGQMTSKPTKGPSRKKPRPSPLPPDSTMIHGEYTVTSYHQPGYQESVESTAASSASKLMPHLSQLILSLKNDVASSRGHRMVPPLLMDDLRKEEPPTTRTLPERQTKMRYDDRMNDYGFLQRNTAIPDEKFGPDEERIFIDDDPYDIDEAIFALQHKDTLKNVPDVIMEKRNSVDTTKSIDYKEEESLRRARKQHSKDRYFRNQRGALPEDLGGEKGSTEKTDRPKVDDFEDSTRKEEKQDADASSTSSDGELVQETPDRSENRQDIFTKDALRDHNEQTTKIPDSGVGTILDVRSDLEDDERTSLKNEFVDDRSKVSEQDNPDELEIPIASQETTINQSTLVEVEERIVKTEEDKSGRNWNQEAKNASRDHDEELDKVDDALSKDAFSSQQSFKERGRNGKTLEVFTSGGLEDEAVTEEPTTGPVLVLGKGESDDLIFEWMTTEWSRCSQTCGGGGFQVRGAQCTVRSAKPMSNSTRISSETLMGATLCEDAGYPIPPKVRSCGSGRCPQWNTGEWSPCETSRCFNWKTAMQKRDVSCRLVEEMDDGTQNVTILDTGKCDDGIRPPQRQECYNDACKGVWRVGEWSDCTASCEEDGIKYRLLQCVWFGTKKPAGNACRDIPRPSVMKTCKGPPCPRSPEECKDHSQLCGRVKTMNMCRVPLYQKQCCQSCR